jgi:hypothetical protein
MIDLTIGQLNDPSFSIGLSPPYGIIETDEGFLVGRSPLMGSQNGTLVCYQAFPGEASFEKSRSWTHPQFRQQLKEIGLRAAKRFDGLPDSTLHATAMPPKLITPVAQVPKLPARPAPSKPGRTGRNDKCPCGSGKKFKYCHGR